VAKRCELDVKNRREAILRLLQRKETAVSKRRIGVSEPTLCHWCDDFLTAGLAAHAVQSGTPASQRKQHRKRHSATQVPELHTSTIPSLHFPRGSTGVTMKGICAVGVQRVSSVKLHGSFRAIWTGINRAVIAYPRLPFIQCSVVVAHCAFAGEVSDARRSRVTI
jgi:hypothetical protein